MAASFFPAGPPSRTGALPDTLQGADGRATCPGAVGRTSTYALCNVTLPWVLRIASRGIVRAARDFPPIARAVNLFEGEVTNKAVAATFDLPYDPRFELNHLE